MKQEHKLYLGIAILALLAGGVYMVQAGEKTHQQEHSVTAAKDLPVVKLSKEEAGKVTKLVIKNADKGEVTLEKKGDEWEVTAPLKAAADQAAVKSLIDNLEKIEIKGTIAVSADVHEKYELDDAKAVHAQAYKGDQVVLDMYFGKRGTRGQMARLGGDGAKPDVYTVDGYASYSWAKELKGWRNKKIFEFKDDEVTAAEVENSGGKLTFSKDGDSWKSKYYPRKDGKLAAEGKAIERFDEAKVKDMLRAYKALKATDFGAKGDETGVDTPLEEGGIVRLTLGGDSPKYVATVGKKQKGSNRYLVKEGEETVFVVTSWTADWATAELKKFQKKEKKEGDKGDDEGGGFKMPSMPGMPGMPGGMPPMPMPKGK